MSEPDGDGSVKVTDWIAEFLDSRGVTHVYELVGGMITHLLDSIHVRGQIEIVSVRHEQAAAFAADAAGRMTGVPGVAMATSGPGATNLLTGIGSAYFDSSPTVFITGQVNRHEQKGTRAVRQVGFQETDTGLRINRESPGGTGWTVNPDAEGVVDVLPSPVLASRPGPDESRAYRARGACPDRRRTSTTNGTSSPLQGARPRSRCRNRR